MSIKNYVDQKLCNLKREFLEKEAESEVNDSTGNDKAGEGRDLYVVQIETIMTELSP